MAPLSPLRLAELCIEAGGINQNAACNAPVYAQPIYAPPVYAQPAYVAPDTGSVPLGTIVSSLPAGCTATVIGNVDYRLCAGTYYRATFQGSSLVYVATTP